MALQKDFVFQIKNNAADVLVLFFCFSALNGYQYENVERSHSQTYE